MALGKLGGLKGEKARAAKLTAEQRSEIALKGARARWANRARARCGRILRRARVRGANLGGENFHRPRRGPR